MEHPSKALCLAAAMALAAGLSYAQSDRHESAEETAKRPPAGPATENIPDRDTSRCEKLEGELREQCLRDLGASTGASVPSKPAPPAAVQRDPVTEPPPQNPRQPR